MLDITNLLENVRSITIGVSQTTGTGNFSVIDDTLPGFVAPNDTNNGVSDGAVIPYHRYYKDLSTAGFEAGTATYHAASGELRDKSVEFSSGAGGDTAITWTADDSLVVFSVPRNVTLMACRVHTQLGPYSPILFTYTGRSNAGITPGENADAVDFSPWLKHWSNDQLSGEYDPANNAWRSIDMTTMKGAQLNTNGTGVGGNELPYSGVPLRGWTGGIIDYYQDAAPSATASGEAWVDTDSDDGNGQRIVYKSTAAGTGNWVVIPDNEWIPNANMFYQTAGYVSMLLGRKGRIVSSVKVLALDGAAGWLYDPTQTNGIAKTLKTQLDLAVAADPDLVAAGVTYPHFHMHSGMSGGFDTTWDTSEYALIMDDVIKAFYDEDRWDICKKEFTRMLLLDGVPRNEETNPNFRGHEVAAELNRQHVTLIPTHGLETFYDTYDTVHYNNQGANRLAQRMIDSICQGNTGSSSGGSGGSAVYTGRATAGFGSTSVADSDSAPANNEIHLNVAQTYVYFSKVQSTSALNLQYYWIRQLKAAPSSKGAIKIKAIFAANWTADIDGPIEDRDTYFALPVTNVSVTTATGVVSVVFENTDSPAWWYGGYGYDELQSRPTLPFAVPALLESQSKDSTAFGVSLVAVDSLGKLERLNLPNQLVPPPKQVTNAVNTVIYAMNRPDWQVTDTLIQLELDVFGYDDADATSTGSEKIVQIWRYTGTVWAAVSSLSRTTYETGLPVVTFVYSSGFFGEKYINARAAGIAGKTWNMNMVLNITVLRQGT